MNRFLLLFALSVGMLSASDADPEALGPLDQVMPATDYSAAGLDKLSPEEREALRAWMERYLAGERRQVADVAAEKAAQVEAAASAALAEAEAAAAAAAARADAAEKAAAEAAASSPIPQGDDAFGLEDVRERVVALFGGVQPDVIESPILGEFEGWSGKTIFRLENGQVWKQSEQGSYYLPRKNPVAIIEKGLMGAYYLKIKGKGKRVKVTRLK